MADKVEKPKMVQVEAIKFHTNAGETYDVGDTYSVEESAVDNLAINGFALRSDRAAVAKQARADAAKSAKATEKAAAAPARKASGTRKAKK